MASPHTHEMVDIDLDQSRRLFFDLKAIKALDRVMGEVGIARALELIRALNFQTLERVIWAGLLHEEPNLTINLVAKRIDAVAEAGKAPDLFTNAYKALNGSHVFGGQEQPEGNAQPEQATP